MRGSRRLPGTKTAEASFGGGYAPGVSSHATMDIELILLLPFTTRVMEESLTVLRDKAFLDQSLQRSEKRHC